MHLLAYVIIISYYNCPLAWEVDEGLKAPHCRNQLVCIC